MKKCWRKKCFSSFFFRVNKIRNWTTLPETNPKKCNRLEFFFPHSFFRVESKQREKKHHREHNRCNVSLDPSAYGGVSITSEHFIIEIADDVNSFRTALGNLDVVALWLVYSLPPAIESQCPLKTGAFSAAGQSRRTRASPSLILFF